MSKRVILRVSSAAGLVALLAIAYGFFESQKSLIEYGYHYWFVSDSQPEPNPNDLRYYPENKTGYYQFNPQTIFSALDRGKTDVFTPLLVDLNDVDVEYDNIAWTQSDFLRVANTLSERIWKEPLDLNGWDVYFILVEGDCSDHFSGFDHFEITYYKTIKTGWETVYTARHIELVPWRGMAEWAGDGAFSTPLIFAWKNVELTKFKITAEQAVRIAEENGGKAARLKDRNPCGVYVDIDENLNRNTDGDWLVDYGMAPFFALIDPFTGEVH